MSIDYQPRSLRRKAVYLLVRVLLDMVQGAVLRSGALTRSTFISPAAVIRMPAAVRVGRHAQIQRGALLYGGRPIGSVVARTGGVPETSGARGIWVGDFVNIREYAVVDAHGGRIILSEGCVVGRHCVLEGQGGLFVGRNVLLGSHVSVIASTHRFNDRQRPIKFQPEMARGIHLRDDIWVGAGTIIMDGVEVGRGAVIGAGAVVTHDVAPFSIVAGVPARVIGQRGDSTDGHGREDVPFRG